MSQVNMNQSVLCILLQNDTLCHLQLYQLSLKHIFKEQLIMRINSQDNVNVK